MPYEAPGVPVTDVTFRNAFVVRDAGSA